MFQTTTPVPLWLEIGKAIIGPSIAAVVVIVGLIWRDRIERRNVAQDWFEQSYITEGLDPVIAHLAVLSHSTFENRRLIYSDIQIQPLSSYVSRRRFMFLLLDFLTGVETAEAVILGAMRNNHPIEISKEESADLLSLCIALSTYADTVRRFLLQTKIRVKSDVYEIANNPTFIRLLKELNDNFLETTDLKTMNAGMMATFRERIDRTAKAVKNKS
jgi:hypothetical protein